MKIELPCEIVRDLLPNYIDGLASGCTAESVDAHLEQCIGCHAIYDTMKKEYRKIDQLDTGNLSASKKEKELFKKIKVKIHKKVQIVISISVVTVILVIVLSQLLFNLAIKEVYLNDVSVRATVYPLKELLSTSDKSKSQYSVTISNAEIKNDEDLYSVNIPELPNSNIWITQGLVDSSDYLTVISWSSPYVLKDILWDYQIVDSQNVLYITNFRTTFFNNKVQSGEQTITTIEHKKVDKIIYLGKDGAENVLWENKSE